MVRPIGIAPRVLVVVLRMQVPVVGVQRVRVAVVRVQPVVVVRVVGVEPMVVVRMERAVVRMMGAMVRMVGAVVRVVLAVVRVELAVVGVVRRMVGVADPMVRVLARVRMVSVVAMVAVQAVVQVVGRVHLACAPGAGERVMDSAIDPSSTKRVAEFAVGHADIDLRDRLAQHHPVQKLAADLGQHGVGQDRVDHAPAGLTLGAA